jgi:hypothetical protein
LIKGCILIVLVATYNGCSSYIHTRLYQITPNLQPIEPNLIKTVEKRPRLAITAVSRYAREEAEAYLAACGRSCCDFSLPQLVELEMIEMRRKLTLLLAACCLLLATCVPSCCVFESPQLVEMVEKRQRLTLMLTARFAVISQRRS